MSPRAQDRDKVCIVDLNSNKAQFDPSLLSLRSMTIQKSVCKSKILYAKQKLAFLLSTKGEVIENASYTQFKYILTPLEEQNLLAFERKIMSLMSVKLRNNDIIKSSTEAFDLFQSRILSDHETSVFVSRVDRLLPRSSPMEMAKASYIFLPIDIRFKPGKAMCIDFDFAQHSFDIKDLEEEQRVEGEGGEGEGDGNGDGEKEEGKEQEDKEEEEEEEKELAPKREEEVRFEKECITEEQDDTNNSNNTKNNMEDDVSMNENRIFDINTEYHECVKLARTALVELKGRENKIKRSLVKYIQSAGNVLAHSKEESPISEKHTTKYVEHKEKLCSLIT